MGICKLTFQFIQKKYEYQFGDVNGIYILECNQVESREKRSSLGGQYSVVKKQKAKHSLEPRVPIASMPHNNRKY